MLCFHWSKSCIHIGLAINSVDSIQPLAMVRTPAFGFARGQSIAWLYKHEREEIQSNVNGYTELEATKLTNVYNTQFIIEGKNQATNQDTKGHPSVKSTPSDRPLSAIHTYGYDGLLGGLRLKMLFKSVRRSRIPRVGS